MSKTPTTLKAVTCSQCAAPLKRCPHCEMLFCEHCESAIFEEQIDPKEELQEFIVKNRRDKVKQILHNNPSLLNVTLNDAKQTILHFAIEHGTPEMVLMLLEKYDLDVNLQDDEGSSSLHYLRIFSKRYQYWDFHAILDKIKDKGGDEDLKNNDGAIPSHICISR